METYIIITLIIIVITFIFIFFIWFFLSDPSKNYESDGQKLIEDFLGVKFDERTKDPELFLDENSSSKIETSSSEFLPSGNKSSSESLDPYTIATPIQGILKPPKDIEIPGMISHDFLFSSSDEINFQKMSPQGVISDKITDVQLIDNSTFKPIHPYFTAPNPTNPSNPHINTFVNSPRLINQSTVLKDEKKILYPKPSDETKEKNLFSIQNKSEQQQNRALLTYEFFKVNRNKYQLIIPRRRLYTIEEMNCQIDGVRLNANQSKGEKLSREVFETIFGLRFPTVRPNILKNPETNHNLEFDGYNPVLKIAFEYSGIQHYEFPNPFHKTKEEFIKLVRTDIYKRQVADQEGIYLIVIPYTVPLNYTDIYNWIVFWLPENVAYRQRMEESKGR